MSKNYSVKLTVKLTSKEKNFIKKLGEVNGIACYDEMRINKNNTLYFYDYGCCKKNTFIEGLKDYAYNMSVRDCMIVGKSLHIDDGVELWNNILDRFGLSNHKLTKKEIKNWVKKHTK